MFTKYSKNGNNSTIAKNVLLITIAFNKPRNMLLGHQNKIKYLVIKIWGFRLTKLYFKQWLEQRFLNISWYRMYCKLMLFFFALYSHYTPYIEHTTVELYVYPRSHKMQSIYSNLIFLLRLDMFRCDRRSVVGSLHTQRIP